MDLLDKRTIFGLRALLTKKGSLTKSEIKKLNNSIESFYLQTNPSIRPERTILWHPEIDWVARIQVNYEEFQKRNLAYWKDYWKYPPRLLVASFLDNIEKLLQFVLSIRPAYRKCRGNFSLFKNLLITGDQWERYLLFRLLVEDRRVFCNTITFDYFDKLALTMIGNWIEMMGVGNKLQAIQFIGLLGQG